ncbi:APC family permease [Citrobacter sp. RHBSTW-00671]|uniref:APC family permease n=1 Tax=Citrobacter sp. RHBSTW-00671 TaxID=2742660 RepID=UPI0017D1A94A|nr:amino acid permease [Citrobacter sp. RHBSTW-00671]MBA7965803.1 amino acid permease [Citrobacter sp. RHBSTW-00671]HCJ6372919.1 amino acid permease [Citrobacter freundii]
MSEKSDARYQMSLITFLFFSIAGGGFVLKGVVSQYTDWGYNSWLLYAFASLFYAIPYTFMIIELSSIKKLRESESGYQTWLNLILGRKLGFIAGFFYFYVNIFYFVDLLPNIITYFIYTCTSDVAFVTALTNQTWFKPVISITSIALFWLATWVSMKGPKWLSRALSFSGYAGFALTMLFIIAATWKLSSGTVTFNGTPIAPEYLQHIDLSWSKIASMSWALQSLGGLEALAAYKRNIRGGDRNFRTGLILNVFIFSGIIVISSILMNFILPADQAANLGLLSAIYVAFQQLGFPDWWTNVIALFLMITTLCGSLMLWTAAPVKMLFVDAPKGIFGHKLSEVNSEGTPVNALKMQGVVVTIIIILFMLGQFNSEMNTILVAVKNLDGGAATIPVLFMVAGYIKLRMKPNHHDYVRDFHFLGKGRFWALLSVAPIVIIFTASTVAALIPGPEDWSANFMGALIQVILGPVSIIAVFYYCSIMYNRWRIKNPHDNSLFNKV